MDKVEVDKVAGAVKVVAPADLVVEQAEVLADRVADPVARAEAQVAPVVDEEMDPVADPEGRKLQRVHAVPIFRLGLVIRTASSDL